MKATHSAGVGGAVPHTSFSPPPVLSPLEVAFLKGREAKRLGRDADNPHADQLVPNIGALASEWDRGYEN